MEQKIIDGQKIIAQFMCTDFTDDVYYFVKHPCQFIGGRGNATEEDLFYYSRFDWQIPVWAKIKEQTKVYSPHSYYITQQYTEQYHAAVDGNDTDAGFKTIVSAIQWLNNQASNKKQ